MNFRQVVEAMERGDWDYVDENLNPNDPEVLKWAEEIICSGGNYDERDLAWTIYGSVGEIPEKIRDSVIECGFAEINREPEDDDDSGRYARYRAAFALAKHGELDSPQVQRVLDEATKDSDVADIAKEFLNPARETLDSDL
ncbi:MAG: hypothetical protein ACOX0Z_04150 [Candidatus Nanosyncoccaceae bacterium]